MPTQGAAVPGKRFWQVLLILLAFETGFFLTLVPWSPVWENNLVTTYFQAIRPFLQSDYVRGAISGLGLVNVWVGFAEARALSRRKKAGQPDAGLSNSSPG